MTNTTSTVDPINYEIFLHRLWAIGEEGRATLQRVSASPIVTQGGECMQSFYDVQGHMVLACAGHLRFAAATSQAIHLLVEWFGESPGFHEGDQIFTNDPYVAGAHTYDQMVIMPIFHEGKLIAWTASSSHTADTGGLMRGGATEIYHEGIRIPALKIVEGGQFRNDVCRSIVDQCRDPYYVELDLRSRIAGNNIAAARFLELVSRFGPEFVDSAFEKMLMDAEKMAREKLSSLPDGVWRSRIYASTGLNPASGGKPLQVVCKMEKRGGSLQLDFTGSSDQLAGSQNSTLAGTLAQVSVALTSTLFWDVSWNDGKLFPVDVIIPEGSVINCKFPAACGNAPAVGGIVVLAITECVAKLLYLGGMYEDVNAGARTSWYRGGPGSYYGGHNYDGIPVAQGLYDAHGSGFGATPTRDGVDTAGALSIPSAGISDIERIELQYPFLYLTRAHVPNGAGYGQHRGGAGSHRVFLVYGSQDLTVPMEGYRAIQSGYGLFGGFPVGTGGLSAVYRTDPATIRSRLREEKYPVNPEQVLEGNWGTAVEDAKGRLQVPEWWIISDSAASGGGFGDPLLREPAQVVADVRSGIFTPWSAGRFFGVVVDQSDEGFDLQATDTLRESIRSNRLDGNSPTASALQSPGETRDDVVLTPHAGLEIARTEDGLVWRCRYCAHVMGSARENYKTLTKKTVAPCGDFAQYPLPAGAIYVGDYVFFTCPSCATLLQVDTFCAEVGGGDELWDIELDLSDLESVSR